MSDILKIQDLHKIIIDQIFICGFSIVLIKNINKHPLHILVKYNNEVFDLRIFVWNITHGGKTRSDDEFRIQIKIPNYESVLRNDILLGYYGDGVFVGYDASKHLNPQWSSSMQIKKDILEKAYINGFQNHTNKKKETVVAFNSSYFGVYIQNYKEIHGIIDGNIIKSENFTTEDKNVDKERDIIYQTIKKKIRAADFRRKVLGAYSSRCCFCDLQLNITEAAHILPVSEKNSTDDVVNGVCLCPNHHKVYDNGLLYINEQYQIIPNKYKADKLKEIKLDSGFEHFINNTRNIIALPSNKVDYPSISYIQDANKLRIFYENSN